MGKMVVRSPALAVVAFLTLAVPPGASCPRTRSGPPVRAVLADAGPYVTSVRVCDRRTGRSRTLARARAHRPGALPATGTRIVDVDAAGRRVAWSVWRGRRFHKAIVVHEVIVGPRVRT